MGYQSEQLDAIERLLRPDAAASLVPMSPSYLNDDRLCLAMFARVPESIAVALERVQSELRRLEETHYYFPRESFHMTVQNVRTISKPPTFADCDIDNACVVARNVALKHARQTVYVAGLMLLPTSVSAYVLFDEPMAKIMFELRDELRAIGTPDNKHYVDDYVRFGNITLCRFTAPPQSRFRECVINHKDQKLGCFEVHGIEVATTNAVYDPAFTTSYGFFPLGSG